MDEMMLSVVSMGCIMEFKIHILEGKGMSWTANNKNTTIFEIKLCATLLSFL